jgi:uncharacterized protein YukE
MTTMASLDETFNALSHFSRAFAEFNEALRASAAELADRHDVLARQWTDHAARAYAQIYEPLDTSLQQYLSHESPPMENFIEAKVRLLDTYLHAD